MKLRKVISVLIMILASASLFACSSGENSHGRTAPLARSLTNPPKAQWQQTQQGQQTQNRPPIRKPEYVPPRIEEQFEDTEPGEEPVDPVTQRVAEIVDSMTLYEKICQMLIVQPDAITGVTGTTVAGEVTKAALEKYPVGGFIHFAPNIVSGEQISLFNSTAQEYSTIPLFIGVDEEGGRVARLRSKLGAHSVQAMLTYRDDGEETALNNAIIISDALKTYGFNTNFAPVADVWSNPANTVIGDRAYCKDFDTAAGLVAAAVRGFKESGIACALKHFPGHGDTHEDSHHSAAYVSKTLDELRENEFKPFMAGIEAGADMVMTGHIIVPEIDDLPATLSKTLITDILRNELGFEGVVITDSLIMNAISKHFDDEFIAVTAISAGIDIILMPGNLDETIFALSAAVESGDISESRIDESVSRIIRLKISMGLIDTENTKH